MLRRDLGDDAFKKGIREFYKRNIFRFASFSDIRVSLEAITGKDLKPDFEQWVIRTGAPKIELNNARAGKYDSNFTVSIVITQVQPGEAYFLRIPIAVTMDGQDRAYQTVGVMKDKRMELKLLLPSRPLRIDIDPEFDIFRRLDIEEIPPAVSQALGAKKMLVILPSTADNKLLKAYKNLVRDIGGSGPDELEVKLDSAIDKLPHDRAIAIIGWENRFLTEITSSASEYGVAFAKKSVRIDRTDIQKKNHAFVLSARVPGNKGLAMLFIASDLIETLPGLGRKIPHYSKYSYLAFEGREAVNVAKGRWPVFNSPLTVFVPNEDGSIIRVDMAKLAPHEPLAAYAPIFTGNK
jgi:hypothetical protein